MEKLIELLNEYEWKKTYKEYMDYQINEELPYKLDSLKVFFHSYSLSSSISFSIVLIHNINKSLIT